jgi:HEAT repeat protein
MALKSKPYRDPVSVVTELQTLVESDPKLALEKARELIRTGGSSVRATAAFVLGRRGDQSDLPALMEAQRLDDVRTRSMRREQAGYQSPFAKELDSAIKKLEPKKKR